MSEETENNVLEDEIAEEEAEDVVEESEDEAEDERENNGPGLRFGILLGLIVGAVVATLLAPPTGEETSDSAGDRSVASGDDQPFAAQDIDFDTPIARMRALLDHLRSRVREATREAELAAHEAEELAHARYAELTHQDGTES